MLTLARPLRFGGVLALSLVALACSEPPNQTDPATDAGTEPSADAGSAADGGSEVRLAEKVVGASGGTVAVSGGASIEIPAGALAADVTITIDEVAAAPEPSGATSMGNTVQFGPEGQTFSSPVKVKIPWSGPSNLPVQIAHAPRGGTTWTVLEDNQGSDATHVWADTTSFSWFQPVVYQGAPDTPIILDKTRPTASTLLIALGSTPDLRLVGTGFRGDTIVTLFKDGVTTATVSPVTLSKWGTLEFKVPAAFTASLGLLTIQAKNPKATVGDQAAVHVVKTPVLQSLSPTSIDIEENTSNDYRGINRPVAVTAIDLPDDFSLCTVEISQSFGQMAVLVANTTAPVKTASGFDVTVADWNHVTGTSDFRLQCAGLRSNGLPITFNKVPKP